MNPMNPSNLITPERAIELGDSRSLSELRSLAASSGKCIVCGEDAWKFAGTGLCFPCTTGESDPSDDFELVSTGVPFGKNHARNVARKARKRAAIARKKSATAQGVSNV